MVRKIFIAEIESNKDLISIVRLHKRNINDLTSKFDTSTLLFYYKKIIDNSGYIFTIKKNTRLVGFVAIQSTKINFLSAKIFINIIKLLIFNFFQILEVIIVYFWLKKFNKKYSYEYSYTVVDKKFSGRGIYKIAFLKILKFLKKKKINKIFIKTSSQEPITTFYKKRYKACQISEFFGRSIMEFNLKKI